MRKKPKCFKELKQSRFGLMMIALTFKGLRKCHFCLTTRKILKKDDLNT